MSTVMIRAKFKLVQVGGLVSEWCCGWVGSWVDGLIEIITISAPNSSWGLGLSLAKEKSYNKLGLS